MGHVMNPMQASKSATISPSQAAFVPVAYVGVPVMMQPVVCVPFSQAPNAVAPTCAGADSVNKQPITQESLSWLDSGFQSSEKPNEILRVPSSVLEESEADDESEEEY